MVTLGSKVKDQFTGFEGIATARTDYLFGCTRILVEPTGLKEDGTTQESEWFDEQRLDPLSEAVSGGPGNVAPNRDPSPR